MVEIKDAILMNYMTDSHDNFPFLSPSERLVVRDYRGTTLCNYTHQEGSSRDEDPGKPGTDIYGKCHV